MAIPTEEHDRAVQRLDAAVTEEHRLTDQHDAAVGTPAEESADLELHAASARVAARRSWLRWIDDASYRGLNAGPFALRRERDDAARSGKRAPRPGKNAKAGPVAKLQRTIAKRLEQSQTPR